MFPFVKTELYEQLFVKKGMSFYSAENSSTYYLNIGVKTSIIRFY